MAYISLVSAVALCLLALCSTLVYCNVAAIDGTDENFTEIYVCHCGDANFLGKYSVSQDHVYDGVPSYINANKKSVFRNNGFWYVGDVSSWPLETHYRCVGHESCPMKRPTPPVPGVWTVNRQVGKAPEPVLQLTPCAAQDEL